MNAKIKVTIETAEADFRQIMLFNLVNKIHYFFKDDVESFINAPEEYKLLQYKLKNYGQQDKFYVHRVMQNLDKFNECGLSKEVTHRIFRNFKYKDIINKYLYCNHGKQNDKIKNENKIRGKSYCNIYVPENLNELREIFNNTHKLKQYMDLKSGVYTKRQQKIIFTLIAVKNKSSNKNISTINEINKQQATNFTKQIQPTEDNDLLPNMTDFEINEIFEGII